MSVLLMEATLVKICAIRMCCELVVFLSLRF